MTHERSEKVMKLYILIEDDYKDAYGVNFNIKFATTDLEKIKKYCMDEYGRVTQFYPKDKLLWHEIELDKPINEHVGSYIE